MKTETAVQGGLQIAQIQALQGQQLEILNYTNTGPLHSLVRRQGHKGTTATV